MAKQMIDELQPGQPVDSVFLVGEASVRTTRTGNSYLNVLLRDSTGHIPGRLWEVSEPFASSIAQDDFVNVKGKVETYQNQLQINIKMLTRADTEGLRLGDFLPQSEHDPAQMMKELQKILKQIEDPDLKALVKSFLDDEAFCAAFRTAPAAMSNHHSYLGGLLEHTLSMMKATQKLLEHYTELRRDLLLTGVFLHDVGKTRELTYRRTFKYSTPGQLVGHLVIGLLMLDEHVAQLEDFPEEKLNMLRHMLLSHHGSAEFGSPKLPMFAEAQALHYIDNLDAKLKDFSDIIADDRNADPDWTDYSRRLERRLYKR